MVNGANTDAFSFVRLVAHLELFKTSATAHLIRGGLPVSLVGFGSVQDHPLVTLAAESNTDLCDALAATPNPSFIPQPRAGYRAIEANISTQRRLRVTKGIYLPADIPMHGIFGSKDVIHS